MGPCMTWVETVSLNLGLRQLCGNFSTSLCQTQNPARRSVPVVLQGFVCQLILAFPSTLHKEFRIYSGSFRIIVYHYDILYMLFSPTLSWLSLQIQIDCKYKLLAFYLCAHESWNAAYVCYSKVTILYHVSWWWFLCWSVTAMVHQHYEPSRNMADRPYGPAAACLSAEDSHQDGQGENNFPNYLQQWTTLSISSSVNKKHAFIFDAKPQLALNDCITASIIGDRHLSAMELMFVCLFVC